MHAVLRLIPVGLVAAFGLVEPAAAADVVSEFQANRALNNAQRMNQTWQARAAVNGFDVGRTFDMAAPGGRRVAAEYAVRLSSRQIAIAGAVSLASRISLPLAIGTAAYELYDAYRTVPDGQGGLVRDTGQEPISQTVQQWSCQGYVGGTPVSACTANFTAKFSRVEGNRTYYLTSPVTCTLSGGLYSCQVNWVSVRTSDGGDGFGGTAGANPLPGTTQQPGCPGYFDVFKGVPVPAGSPIGSDGKCATGAYTTPQTAQEVADQALAGQQFRAIDYDALVREALGNPATGGIGITNDMDRQVNAPAYVAGPESTTSNPDGTVTTTATGWNLARDPLRRTEVIATPTSTSTTRTASGTVVGTPTTTTGANAAGDPATDPCVGDPGRLGCIGLGTAPAVDVPKSTVSVSWAAEAIGLPAGCPAPLPLHDGYMLSFQWTCDALVLARPVVVAGAAFTALLMVLAALRVQ